MCRGRSVSLEGEHILCVIRYGSFIFPAKAHPNWYFASTTLAHRQLVLQVGLPTVSVTQYPAQVLHVPSGL